ncbi:IS4 family transposase [Patescibacteria group bacterium]|nr:IS4 family transposase [Patescibacteria group bacterium]
MHQGKFIFAQIVELIYRHDFDRCVKRYNGNSKIRQLTCRDQLLAMMFGQLTNLKSLSGIVSCLNAHSKKLYHLGFKINKFVLSTLTRANENRDWRIYRDLAQLLIEKAGKLYVQDNDFKLELNNSVYVLDSTIIELCLGTFRWAYFELGKSAVKIHTQLDLKGNIPSFFLITEAKTHDVNFLDQLEIEKGAFYIMDRGYFDFERLYVINSQDAFFIIRAKSGLSFQNLCSGKIGKASGLRCDQIIKLKHFYSRKHYPKELRRIKYYDIETNKYYVYLTNNFDLDAKVIADLYKRRWQIELFFKWIKQHLRIEVFWGRSFNAVKTQICIAMCAFLTIAIAKKRLKVKLDLYEILQILSVSQFDKTPINTLLSEVELQIFIDQPHKQQCLWDI